MTVARFDYLEIPADEIALNVPDAGPFYIPLDGLVRNGVETTFGPETDVQPGAPGPFAHPHQFTVALTEPPPRLSTPIALPKRLLRWASMSPFVLAAMSTFSSLITFSTMTVPVVVAPEVANTLIPLGPGVAASSVSAPLPAI